MGGSKNEAEAGYKDEARWNAYSTLMQQQNALNQGNNLKYAKTNYDTGLYGSSVSDRNGTTWTPTSFQSQLVNYTQDNIPALLNQYITPTTDSAWYQANKAIRQQAQNDAFENQVINPLASRNLTRGSSVNALSNMFANDIARQEQQALLDESNRAGQLAQTLLGYYQIPYNMMFDSNKMAAAQSEAVSNYDLNKYNAVNNVFANYAGLLDSIYRGQQATNINEARANNTSNASGLGSILGGIAPMGMSLATSSLSNLGSGGGATSGGYNTGVFSDAFNSTYGTGG